MLTREMADRRRDARLRDREPQLTDQLDEQARFTPASSTQDLGQSPAYLDPGDQADLVFEPLYVTAMPPPAGFDMKLDEQFSELAPMDSGPAPDQTPAGAPAEGGGAPDQLDAVGGPSEGAAADTPDNVGETKSPPPAADKDKEKDKAKGKGAEGDGSAGGPAEQPGKGKAEKGEKRTRKGSAARSGGSPEAEGDERLDWMPPTPLIADTTPVSIPRVPFYLRVDPIVFDAPHSFPLVSPRPRDAPAVTQPKALPDYRSAYAEAAASAYDLFLGMQTAAQRLAEETSDVQARLADTHISNLGRTVDGLDRGLEQARLDLRAGRDATLATLEWRAGLLRRHIRGTASAQIRKLEGRWKEFEDGRRDPIAVRKTTEDYATKKVSELKVGLDSATKSLEALKGNKSVIHVDGDWSASTNEAMDGYVPKVTDKSLAGFADMRKSLAPLGKLAHCLPCQFDGLFMSVNAAADRVGKAGPAAVREARDGGLSSLREAERQLRRGIIESAAATDDAMVKQHQMVRRRLIDSAVSHLDGEEDRVRTMATRQIDMLVSMAQAQPGAVRGMLDRLEGMTSPTEATLAEMTTQASRRLKTTLARTAVRQPMAIMLAARNQLRPVHVTAEKFDLALERNKDDTARNNHGLTERTLDQLHDEIDKQIESMSGVPRSLIKLCAGFFEPQKPPYTKLLTDLAASVNKTYLNTKATFEGGEKPKDDKPDTPPAADKAPMGDPVEPPKSCGGCAETEAEKEKVKQDKEKQDKEKKAEGDAQNKDGKKPPPKKPTDDDLSNPVGMTKYAKKVGDDVKKDHLVGPLHSGATEAVPKKMRDRMGEIRNGLAPFAANRQQVLGALKRTTEIQGNDFRKDWGPAPSLDDTIRTKFKRGWSAPKTKREDRNSALAALKGNVQEATIAELRSAFNLFDENQRAFDALLALSPDALDKMSPEQMAELREMASELEGINKEKFQALLDKDVKKYNALSMKGGVKSKRDEEGETNWTKVGDSLGEYEKGAGASALSGNADQFGIDPTEDGRLHAEKMWKDTVLEYGKLELKEGATHDKDGKELTSEQRLTVAQDALIKLATETRTHTHTVYGPNDSEHTYETTDIVDDEHKKWIERIVRKGSEHEDTLAARIAIAEKTKNAKLAEEHMRKALHFGSADAVEGGGYNAEVRAKGLEDAEQKRTRVLTVLGQDKAEKKTGIRPDASTIKVDEVAADLKLTFETTHSKDKLAADMLVGIVQNPRGSPLTTIEYAIAHENKEMILAQFKRMDRKEVEKLIKDYAEAHPGKPGLDQVLGINGHHWAWYNWNGAVFSGDDANEIEIARMGVPQNPKERGEVALRVMDQQISQSTWLGRSLAGDEYDALVVNATKLRDLMGVNEADIDEHGYIRTEDPLTGRKVRIGNFDEQGNFVPPEGGNADAFEKAVALASVTAENFTSAVDRIGNFVATALVVLVAIASTIATGGGAASIWLPMLITAAAGVAGMGFKMALKGGRYGRDEMVRDLVSTAVQTVTAGIGSAAGVLMRGGPAALKALAGSWRMSEQMLAQAAGKTAMLRSLILAEDLIIGAGTSALNSTVTTAFDPAMMRRDDYDKQVWGSFFRGAFSGAVSAGVTRGVMGGTSRLSRAMGARSGARDALSRGASPEAAARFAALRSRAYGTSALTEVGGRSLATATAGALSRAAEMKFDETFMGKKYTAGEYWSAMGESFVQGAIQGGLEAAGDRMMRRLSPKRAAEHAFTVQDDAVDYHRRGMDETYKQAVAMGLIERAPVTPPSVGDVSAPQKALAGRPPEADGAPPPASRSTHEPEALPMPGVRPVTDGAPLDLPASRPPDGEAIPHPTIGIDEHGGPVPIARTADDRPSMQRPAEGAEAGDPLLRAMGDQAEPGTRPIIAANDDGPTQRRIDLSTTDMVQLGKIAEGTVVAHPDITNRMAANDNFGRMILADPGREVALLRNPITGEHIVIQGAETRVGGVNAEGKLYGSGTDGRAFAWQSILDSKGGHWIVEHHYHPNLHGEKATALVRRLPSGAGADFSVIIREATALGYTERSSRIYYIDEGKVAYTDFGVDRGNPEKPYWIDIPDPVTKARGRYEFASLTEYHTFVSTIIGETYPLPKGFVEPTLAAILTGPPARALESGSVHQSLASRDVADVHAVVKDSTSAPPAEVHERLRGMGLVGEPDAMARLHLVVNDESITIDTKRQFAALVLEANRSHMIAAGTLHPDEPIHLIFHGAPEGRSSSIREGGIDPSKLKKGSADDFGKGLYFSRDLESAYLYARRNVDAGEVFPFLMRQRDLGEVIDVREDGQHRAAWDEFLDRQPAAFPPYARSLIKNAREWATATGKYRPNEPERGLVFEAFLAERGWSKAAVIHGDLGRDALTGGIGRGDQFSLRSQLVADLFNAQLGFRRTGPTPAEEPVMNAIGDSKGRRRKTEDKDQEAKPPKPDKADKPARPRLRNKAAETEAEGEAGSEESAATATATAPKKRRRGAQPLDLNEAEAATLRRQADEDRANQQHEAERRAKAEASDPDTSIEKLEASRPPATREAEQIIARILSDYPEARGDLKPDVLESLADEIDLVLRLDKTLSDATHAFLKWKETVWRKQMAMETVSTTGKRRAVPGLGDVSEVPGAYRRQMEDLAAGGERRKVQSIAQGRVVEADMRAAAAREAETDATRSVKQEMRRTGDNYKAKKKAEFDEVLGRDRFNVRQAQAKADGEEPILLSPDHLVPLDDISNMEELKPLFAIYNRALPGQRDVIRQALRDLGDIPENLVAFQRYPNEHIKRAKTWENSDHAALRQHGYTDDDVDHMIGREREMRAKIIDMIEDLIRIHSARLAAERPLSFKQPIQIEEPEESLEEPVDG